MAAPHYTSPLSLHDLLRESFTLFTIFFCREGPRSRRYVRKAAMRLIVQPYDEDERDDYYFCHFPSNGEPVE
jgi:hypothetical protein